MPDKSRDGEQSSLSRALTAVLLTAGIFMRLVNLCHWRSDAPGQCMCSYVHHNDVEGSQIRSYSQSFWWSRGSQGPESQKSCALQEEGFRPCSPLPSMAAKKPSQEGKSSASPKSRSWYPAEEKYAAMAKPSLSPAAQEDLIGGGEQLSPSSATSSTASKLEGFPQQAPEALLRQEGAVPPGEAKQAQPSEGRMCVMTDEKNVEFLEELLEAASLRPAPKKAQSFGTSNGSASGKETPTPREKATSRVSVGSSSKGSEAKTEQPAFPRPQASSHSHKQLLRPAVLLEDPPCGPIILDAWLVLFCSAALPSQCPLTENTAALAGGPHGNGSNQRRATA